MEDNFDSFHNYLFFVFCSYPTEYTDDAQSRYINKRAHGNIKKDSTYDEDTIRSVALRRMRNAFALS